MAFSKITEDEKRDKGVIGLPATPNLTTTEMQEKFDELGNLAISGVNRLVDELEKTTAAKNIGTANGNLQEVLNTISQTGGMSQEEKKAIEDVTEKVGILENSVSELSGSLNVVVATTNEITEEMNDLASSSNDIAEGVSNVKLTVVKLQESLEQLQTEQDATQNALENSQNAIASNKEAITKIDARVTSLENGGNTGGSGESSGSSVSDVTIQYMQEDISTLQTDMASTTESISALQTDMASTTESISTLQTDIAGVASVDEKSNFVVGIGAFPDPVAISASQNVVIGRNAMANAKIHEGTGYAPCNNIALGLKALENTDDEQSIAIGYFALKENYRKYNVANDNVAIGCWALQSNNQGTNNIAIGRSAMGYQTDCQYNIAIGNMAFSGSSSDENAYDGNVAIGYCAMGNSKGNNNTAIGYRAGRDMEYSNCVSLGYQSTCTADNQVQLGNVDTTPYAYASLQNRSDARDKTDIHNTSLGLEFIEKLRPVEYRWDYRENYEDGVSDGSKAGKRFHQGFIAQEVKQVMDELGIDFAGYQDHSVNGGKDVLSLGYTEFIAPMIKAIQELSAEVRSLKNELNLK